MLKSAFVSADAGTHQNTTAKTTANAQKSDIIDAEFKVIKEE